MDNSNRGTKSPDETDIREEAERREKEIELALSGSKFHAHVNTSLMFGFFSVSSTKIGLLSNVSAIVSSRGNQQLINLNHNNTLSLFCFSQLICKTIVKILPNM